jgi:hypothetical protein
MRLTPSEPPERRRPPVWRGALLAVLTMLLFLASVAVAAYATRDSAGPVRPPVPDAGIVLPVIVDAGPVEIPDAGELTTVEAEPDSGPVGVAGPPVEPAALSAAAKPILETCLREALRFDPSFGGKLRVRVEVRGRTLGLVPPPGTSPVFAGCATQQKGRLEGAPATANAELRVVLDGLRGVVTIEETTLLE